MPEHRQDTVAPIAIVTGASSGLGRRFAEVLHADGATVVGVARRADRLADLGGELGEQFVPITCDVSVTSEREALVERVVAELGRIDILVNNAGTSWPGPSEDEPIDRFAQVMDVNVTAVFHLSQLAGRSMLARGSGVIVNIASILGLVASAPAHNAAYCASKAAVVNLTRQLGAEWGARGVRVNAIAPGWFESELTTPMWEEGSSAQAFVRRGTPLGRGGEPGELDDVLRLLVGPGGTFFCGQTIVVDGGWTAR